VQDLRKPHYWSHVNDRRSRLLPSNETGS